MKQSKLPESGLPSMGEVLGFCVDCLGVPKEHESYTHKELQRLRRGGLSPDKYWKIAHRLIVAILEAYLGAPMAEQTVTKLFLQKLMSPRKRDWVQAAGGLWVPIHSLEPSPDALHWKVNEAGQIENQAERLVLDWMELLERNEFLRHRTAGTKRSAALVERWASVFVLPFVACNLIEYLAADSSIESGMPGGSFWYLPEVEGNEDGRGCRVTKWPVNKVLAWWEDLLGTEFYANPKWLCPKEDPDSDDARRKVHYWRFEKRPPEPETIMGWCKQDWGGRYKGTFVDNETMPLHERWNRCRAFLARKGLDRTTTSWVEAMPEEQRTAFKQAKYRGEALELQILRFRECAFADFFRTKDPIAQGLPVAELISRVAVRFAQPTNEQVRGRLMMAAALQRAFLKLEEMRGTDYAARLFGLYQGIYDYLMRLNNAGSGRDDARRFLAATPKGELPWRYRCEWLYDERCWYELPGRIAGGPSAPS